MQEHDDDELFRLLAEENKKYESLPTWQKEITVGQHYFTSLGYQPDGRTPGSTIAIYGVITEVNYGENPSRFLAGHYANRVRVRAYSRVVPEGERGESLRNDIAGLISPEAFERAKAAGWPSDIDRVMDVVEGEPHWEFGRGIGAEGRVYLLCIYRDGLVYAEEEQS